MQSSPERATPHEVTRLLGELRSGNPEARERLIPLVYEELHRRAAMCMRRERPDHTLQATGLVTEAYERLVAQKGTDWKDRVHFFSIASHVMREILVEHARARRAQKRGGELEKLPLDEAFNFLRVPAKELIELNDALDSLALLAPRQAEVVEMRFFGGMTKEEIAEALHISPVTVKRDWRVARAWLRGELSGNTQRRLSGRDNDT